MTRNITISAHDLDKPAWETMCEVIESAVILARKEATKGATTLTGSIYDSNATPQARVL